MSHPWDCDGGLCPDCQADFFEREQERLAEEERSREELERLQRLDAMRELRKASGDGVMDCREALDKHGWDVTKATMHLKAKGLAIALNPTRVTPCGSPTCPADACSYAHTGSLCQYCGWWRPVNPEEDDFQARA